MRFLTPPNYYVTILRQIVVTIVHFCLSWSILPHIFSFLAKNTLKVTKNLQILLKVDFERWYFNLRTIDKILKIEPPKCS